eukprot:6194584-Pleurochrysis_carterae.AAC.4
MVHSLDSGKADALPAPRQHRVQASWLAAAVPPAMRRRARAAPATTPAPHASQCIRQHDMRRRPSKNNWITMYLQ